MVDINKTEIVVVLDRSGSMESIRADTVGGFNTFIHDQKNLPGECNVTLTQFDDTYEIVYQGVPIRQVKPLSVVAGSDDFIPFVPRGSTALLDAIGRTINTVGEALSSKIEDQRPGRVFFVIITDGYENASREFTRDKIFEMIKHQREKYSWDFIFLAAGQDAIQVGASYGIAGGSSMTCSGTSSGVQGTYGALSNKLGTSRGTSKPVVFDTHDRKRASS